MLKADYTLVGTDVTATTLHALLELDGELKTKLDLAKLDHAKVAALMEIQVLLLDEVSMLDIDARLQSAAFYRLLIIRGGLMLKAAILLDLFTTYQVVATARVIDPLCA